MRDKKEEIFFSHKKSICKHKKLYNEMKKLSKKFMNFLEKYRTIDNFHFYFRNIFQKKLNGNICKITIDLLHIAQFDPVLYFYILKFPSELISICDYTMNKILENSLKKKILKKKIRISFFSTIKNQSLTIKNLGPEHLNKIIVVEGVVIKLAYLSPEMTTAFFKCELCNYETYYFIEKGKILEPIYCFNCKNFNSFQLILNRCGFTERQYLFIQETFASNFYRKFPMTLLLIAYDEIIEKIEIGDHIKAIGILRISSFTKLKMLTPNVFFYFYMDILDIRLKNSRISYRKNFVSEEFNSKKKTKIFSNFKAIIMMNSLIQNPKIYKSFYDSMKIDLKGVDTIKQGILIIFIKIIWEQTRSGNLLLFNKLINLLMLGKTEFVESSVLKFIPKFFPNVCYVTKENIDIIEKKKSKLLSKQKGSENSKISQFFFAKNFEIFSLKGIDKFPKNIINFFQEILDKQTNSCMENYRSFQKNKRISLFGSINSSFPRYSNRIYKKDALINEIFKPIFVLFDLIYYIKDSISIFKDLKFAKQILNCNSYKSKEIKINFSGIGFKKKIFHLFLKNFQYYPVSFLSEFSSKELLKWEIIYSTLKNFNENEFIINQVKVSELLINISFYLTLLRFSSIVGSEDIRYAVIILIEALKSYKNRIFI
jgi:DNA replication licensing factor MCM4